MADQAANLRHIAKINSEKEFKNKKAPRIITVTSGKGGVGKTNVVVNLGISLAEMGHKVVILDADFGLANAEVLLGLAPNFSLYDVLKGDKQLTDVIVQGPYDLRLIPGGTGLKEIVFMTKFQQDKIVDGLRSLENKADFILIDTGAGINKTVLSFVAAADEVIVVVTPEPTSLTDAYSLIKVMSKYKARQEKDLFEVNLLLNKVSSEKEAKQSLNKLKLVASKFLEVKINDLGFIPEDRLVVKSVKEQFPFSINFPSSQATISIKNIASLLSQGKVKELKGMTRFLTELIGLFR